MKKVSDAGADGMTVNFPDLLLCYIAEKEGKNKLRTTIHKGAS